MLFPDLLSLHFVTFLMFYILVHVPFFSSRQQMHAWAEVCHLLQSSKSPLTGFLCSIGWRIIGFLQTLPALTVFLIQQSCVIVTFRCWFVRMLHVKKKLHCYGSHSSSVSGSNRLVWLQTWNKSDGLVHCSVKNAAVLCENHRERVMQIWTSPSEEEKEEKHFGCLVTFWFGTSAMLFSATGWVVHHENTQRWRLIS